MTTTELATQDMGRLEVLPPAQQPAHTAMAVLQAHADMMDMAYVLANKMCRTQLVPMRYRNKAEDATAAILYGAELGLNPIQSLQRVIPIHGMPTLEALTMVGLLEAHGYTVKTVESSDAVCEVHGWKPGRDPAADEPDAKSRWTIERAQKAGYVPRPASEKSPQRPWEDDDWVTVTKTFDGRSKKSVVGNMKYITDPQAMLTAKGRTVVCKELAPHILLGIGGSTEDMRTEYSDDEPTQATAAAPPVRAESVTVEEVLGGEPAAAPKSPLSKVKPAPEPEPVADEPQDAEVVEDDQDVPPPEPEASAEPAEQPGASATDTPAADGPEPVPEFPVRWQSRLDKLFGQAGIPKEDKEDRATVTASILNGAKTADALTPDDVLRLLGVLGDWVRTGKAEANVREILNTALIQAEQAASNEH